MRSSRQKDATACGCPAPGPKRPLNDRNVDQKAEPACDVSPEEFEEVHNGRLSALLDIYEAKQKAAQKPMKRLSGAKFWIAGHVHVPPVVMGDFTMLLLMDAVNDAFYVQVGSGWAQDDLDGLKVCLLHHT